jgi:hypothetical protein
LVRLISATGAAVGAATLAALAAAIAIAVAKRSGNGFLAVSAQIE